MYKIKPYKMCSGNPQSTGYYLEWEIRSKDLNCCTEDTHPLGVQTDKALEVLFKYYLLFCLARQKLSVFSHHIFLKKWKVTE